MNCKYNNFILGHVYILSRPSLKAISKLVNRVKSIKIYGDEDV